MKRVLIKNKLGIVNWQSEEYANPTQWIEKQIAANSWGLPERIVEAIPGTYDPADVLEQIPEVVEGDVTVSPAKVRLKAEYVVEVEDITAELAEREAVKQKLEADKARLKDLKGKNLSSAEVKEAVEKILEVLGL